VEIGHWQKKRLPPEYMLYSAKEGDMSPQEGCIELLF
jgi:hypothetical protein